MLADVSTVSPALARRLAEEGPEGQVLDTPYLGSPSAVASGSGSFLVGGPPEALAVVAPVLDTLGSSTQHCGPSGAGAVLKLVANLLLVTGVAAMAEGIAVARRQGIGDDLLRRVLPDLPVLSGTSRLRLDAVLDPAHEGWFGPALAPASMAACAPDEIVAGARGPPPLTSSGVRGPPPLTGGGPRPSCRGRG